MIEWRDINDVVKDKATASQRQNVRDWCRTRKEHDEYFNDIKTYYETIPQYEILSEGDFEKTWSKIVFRQRQNSRIRLLRGLSVAASILFLIGFSISAFIQTKQIENERSLISANAGKYVVITSEDGSELILDEVPNKVLDRTTEVSQTKTIYVPSVENLQVSENIEKKIIAYHTLTVPRGKTYQLQLPDSTIIFLNPETVLTYPTTVVAGEVRKVSLSGEAFFEVNKNGDPFIVSTSNANVTVYGTEFNINARNNQNTSVTLSTGSVGIKSICDSLADEVILVPGQCSEINDIGDISVYQIDLAEYKARRKGFLMYNGKRLEDIVNDLRLYYDFEFVFIDAELKNLELIMSLNRQDELSTALESISLGSNIEFTINGKEVLVRKR